MRKTIKNILPFLIKIFPFSLLILGVFLNYNIKLDEKNDILVADIIIALLPMVFTIITIALSLPSEKIYGVSSIDFRRIRNKYCFSFLEMIIWTIIIFALYFLFTILGMTLVVWSLNIISLIYSFWFVVLEVPILTHSNRMISRIVSQAWQSKKYTTFNYGNNSNDMIMTIIMQNMVIENGIVSTYNLLKTKDSKKNSIILDSLLSYNNDYLFECDDNSKCFANGDNGDFKGINIIKAIDMSLENISSALSFNDDFNIAKIFNDSKKYYHISRMVFTLKRITDVMNLKEKYSRKMSDSLKMLFMHLSYSHVDDCEFDWAYNFLNGMMVYSVSSNELWFLRLLRNSNFNSLFSVSDKDNYYYFVSIYLYYIYTIDKKVPNNLKIDIEKFLKEEADGLNADGSNWISVFNHKFNYTSFNDMINLLPSMLRIIGDDSLRFPWYQPKHCTSWSSDEGVFSKQLIINCWLELIIYNYNSFNFEEEVFLVMVNKLKPEDRYFMASILNTKWFNNNEFNPIKDKNSFLSMFRNKEIDILYENQLIKCLKEVKNKIIHEIINKEFDEHIKTDEDLINYKNALLNGFDKAVSELACYNPVLEIQNDNYLCFDSLFDTRWTEELIKTYSNNFGYSFKNIIKELLIADDKIKHLKCDMDNVDFIKTIDRYDYIAGNKHKLYYDLFDEDKKIIQSKKEMDLWLPIPLFVKDDKSIQINIVSDTSKSFVRRLNDNEINIIIDRDYKVTNGLYKYCDSNDDSRSIFISRKQLFDLISKKYFCARIVFRREIKIDYEKVVFIDMDDKE